MSLSTKLSESETRQLDTLFSQWIDEFEKKDEQFPVDFDDAWKIIGYSRKHDAKLTLEKHFVHANDKCGDYRISQVQGRGRPKELISLSLDCFKHFCMIARTERGNLVRQYFIEVEKRWRGLNKKLRDGSFELKDVQSGLTFNDYLDSNQKRGIVRKQFELDLAEREERVKKMRIENRQIEVNTFKSMLSLFDDNDVDERGKILLNDVKFRFIAENMPSCLTENTQQAIEYKQPISIQTVATKCGLKYNQKDAGKIGKCIAKLYRARHNGESPPKSDQIIGGKVISVNSYFSDDEDLVKYAVMYFATNRNETDFQQLCEDLDELL